MFVPYPLDAQSFSRTPVIWALIFMNVFGFLVLADRKSEISGKELLFETPVMALIGESYFDQILNKNNEVSEFDSSTLSSTQKVWLAVQALKDNRFLKEYKSFAISSDPILQKKIDLEIENLIEQQSKRSSAQVGLFHGANWKSYITYQLTHADFLHLLSNMVFLFGIGFILEIYLGQLGFGLLYFLCGAFGGWLFLEMNPHSFTPMVGASGSVSGLLAFFALVEKRKNIRYAFFLSPLAEHHGMIHAPKWWILVFFLLTDLAQVIANPSIGGGSGVAYSAHLGGAIMGVIMAVMWNTLTEKQSGLNFQKQ